ncbi:MAG: hypothetical protein ABFE07_03840 [Armatimonadia bacterium]
MRQIVERAPVPAMRKGFSTGGMRTTRRGTPMAAESGEPPEVVERRLAEDRSEAGSRWDRGPAARGLRVEGRRPRGWVPLPYSLFERRGLERRMREAGEAERAPAKQVEVEGRWRTEAQGARGEVGREVLRSRQATETAGRPWAQRVRREAEARTTHAVGGVAVSKGARRRFGDDRAEALLRGDVRIDGGMGSAAGETGRLRRRGRFDAEEGLRLELVR